MTRSGGLAEDPLHVEVRGYRIGLGDVEAALTAHPGVKNAAVFVQDGKLVAYVVSATADVATLRAHLACHLNDWMIPSTIVLMDALPLTPSGEIDRMALPVPVPLKVVYAAPRTAEEKSLCAIVADVLRLERVGINDNFFELGGHSLLAMQLLSCIREEFKVDLPVHSVFEETTIGDLARAIVEQRQSTSEATRKVPRRGPDASPILFPTEPGSLPQEGIDATIWQVLAAKKKLLRDALQLPQGERREIAARLLAQDSSVVSANPAVMSGAPVFSGTRVLVQTLIEHLEAGDSIDDFLEGFPSVTREQVIAFLEETKARVVAYAE